MSTLELLNKFVNQRPGLDFCNYGDVRLYRSEMREITRDRSDYYELLGVAASRLPDLNEKLTAKLLTTSDRLELKEGRLEYCTGQYFPTEYRTAACRALRDLIWADFRDEKDAQGQPIYKDGHEIRKAIKRRLSRRVAKNYFN